MDCWQQTGNKLIYHNFNHLSALPELITPMIQRSSVDKNEVALCKGVHTGRACFGSQPDRGRTCSPFEAIPYLI